MISEAAPQQGEDLRHQLLISHLANATGCDASQAAQLLQASRWEFELALSLFFQDPGLSSPSTAATLYPPPRHINPCSPMEPPCNTPATPPSFPDALLGLSKMAASDWGLGRDAPAVLVASNHNPFPGLLHHDWAITDPQNAPKEISHSGMLHRSENSQPPGSAVQPGHFPAVDGSSLG